MAYGFRRSLRRPVARAFVSPELAQILRTYHRVSIPAPVVEQVIAKLSMRATSLNRFALNEAFRQHCPEPLRCVDIRDAVNQLRSKGQSVTHIIVANGVEVPDDLNLIIHRFPVAEGFVLSGATEAPILLTRDSGFEYLSNLTDPSPTPRASFAIERRVGVSIVGPLHLCCIAPAA